MCLFATARGQQTGEGAKAHSMWTETSYGPTALYTMTARQTFHLAFDLSSPGTDLFTRSGRDI